MLTPPPSDVSDFTPLRADLGLSDVRWLGPGDALHLVELIRGCYGETYAHAALYRPDAIEAAWANGSLLSLGHFDERGRLDAHTGFWRKERGRPPRRASPSLDSLNSLLMRSGCGAAVDRHAPLSGRGLTRGDRGVYHRRHASWLSTRARFAAGDPRLW